MSRCRPATAEEFQRVLRAFSGPLSARGRAMWVLGCTTGYRISELLSLNLGDVVDDAGHIRTEIDVQRRSMKGAAHSRRAWLEPPVRSVVAEWVMWLNRQGQIHASVPLFCSRAGKRMSRFHAYRILKAAYRRAGLGGHGWATHTMRKTFARQVERNLLTRHRAGEPLNVLMGIQEALGHRQITSTTSYLAFDRDALRDSFRAVAIGLVGTQEKTGRGTSREAGGRVEHADRGGFGAGQGVNAGDSDYGTK